MSETNFNLEDYLRNNKREANVLLEILANSTCGEIKNVLHKYMKKSKVGDSKTFPIGSAWRLPWNAILTDIRTAQVVREDQERAVQEAEYFRAKAQGKSVRKYRDDKEAQAILSRIIDWATKPL